MLAAVGTMNILQVNTFDTGGGAEKVARSLHEAYLMRGHAAWFAVGWQRGQIPNTLRLPHERYPTLWQHFWIAVRRRILPHVERRPVLRHLAACCATMLELPHTLTAQRGHEDFLFPATAHLPELLPQPPDILHGHNLHGGYFDLRQLPQLSRRLPVVLSLHDAWLLGGHCVHSFACERWQIGCGDCPDLTIPYAIRRDATISNWRQRALIYRQAQLYVVTPCEWLQRKVERSNLMPGIKNMRVIPNGIDLTIFQPADKPRVRQQLGIPHDAATLLFAANGCYRNRWKDYETMRAAVAHLSDSEAADRLLFLALGEAGQDEQIGRAMIRWIPYQADQRVVAQYYQAADVYLHGARADTFPNAVLESLACGTPVVATQVGGIPEQIEQGVTGFLTPECDPASMADALRRLLADADLKRTFGVQAAESARRRFNLSRMVDDYLTWYHDVIQAEQQAAKR